jgi:hypothetical protein
MMAQDEELVIKGLAEGYRPRRAGRRGPLAARVRYPFHKDRA